jgi:hypothetical protein
MKFRFSNGILQNKDTANTMYILWKKVTSDWIYTSFYDTAQTYECQL